MSNSISDSIVSKGNQRNVFQETHCSCHPVRYCRLLSYDITDFVL